MAPRARENQRVRLTKRLLKESLLDLLEEKPLEKITVRELCEHSELNRSTFYANYSDIYQLYQEMCDELTDGLEAYVQETSNQEGDFQTIQKLLEYIHDHERLYSRLFYQGTLSGNHNPIQARINALTAEHIAEMFPDLDPQYRDYIIRYCYTGSNALIAQWIQNRFDLSPEVLARMSFAFSRQITEFARAHLLEENAGQVPPPQQP